MWHLPMPEAGGGEAWGSEEGQQCLPGLPSLERVALTLLNPDLTLKLVNLHHSPMSLALFEWLPCTGSQGK